MRTTSVLIVVASPASCSLSRAAIRHAHMMRHVILELIAEVLHEALHGPRRGVAERADRVTLDLVRDVDEHVELLLATLPALDATDDAVHPARAFAAGRALPAGLGVVEARDALENPHHAGRLVHDDDGARAERRSGRTHRVVVHRDRHDLVG